MNTVKETHAIAQKSARRLTDLTAALLDLALISEQEHEFKTSDLNLIMSGIIELLNQSILDTNTQISVSNLPVVHGNSALLSRLFLNLVSNAIKYRKPGRNPEILIKHEDFNTNTDYVTCLLYTSPSPRDRG